MDGDWVAEEQSEDLEGLAKALDEIRTLIVPLVPSLKGLQSVAYVVLLISDNSLTSKQIDGSQ